MIPWCVARLVRHFPLGDAGLRRGFVCLLLLVLSVSSVGALQDYLSDDFNRPDSPGLGDRWGTLGAMRIANGLAVGERDKVNFAYRRRGTASFQERDATLTVEVDVRSRARAIAGVFARGFAPGGYVGVLTRDQGAFEVVIARLNQVVPTIQATTLASVPVTTGRGRLRFQVSGDELSLAFNDVLMLAAQDPDRSTSQGAGLLGYNGSFDNFCVTSPTLCAQPFSCEFAPDEPDGTSNAGEWTVTAGSFSQGFRQFTASTAELSLAVPNPLSLMCRPECEISPDQRISARTRLEPAGPFLAGLVARLSATQFYLGAVVGRDGNFFLTIWRYEHDQFFLLNSAPLTLTAIPPFEENLSLLLQGSQLLFAFGGVVPPGQHITAIDDRLTGSGYTGVLGLNTTFIDFSTSPF